MKDIIFSIDKERLNENVEIIRNQLPKGIKLCAVVKCDAYGHGIKAVCDEIVNKVDYFAVTNNREAVTLKRRYPDAKVLVLGGFSTYYLLPAIKYGVEFGIDSKYDLDTLSKYCRLVRKRAKIHIKVNTGMNRLGLDSVRELSEFYDELKKYEHIILVGIFSHLGSGDKFCNRNFEQIMCFQKFCDLSPVSAIRHLCNSSFYAEKPCYDMVRAGIALYGYNFPNVRPILDIKARIAAIKTVKKGEYIGYGNEHKARKNMKTATVMIGYGEGLPRLWAKRGYMLVNGVHCPICANICMDMTIVDVSNVDVSINDYATVIGQNNGFEITASEIADCAKTIEYEILTNFKKAH